MQAHDAGLCGLKFWKQCFFVLGSAFFVLYFCLLMLLRFYRPIVGEKFGSLLKSQCCVRDRDPLDGLSAVFSKDFEWRKALIS